MFLHTLLRTLKSKINSHGYKDDDLFIMLFEGFQDLKSGNDIYTIESSLGNIISGSRAVKDILSKQLMTPSGFDLLQSNIECSYLPLIQNGKDLYEQLLQEITNSNYILNAHKKQIINQYTHEHFSDISLASLIALCVLIGNYNTSIRSKIGSNHLDSFFENYELNIGFIFGSTNLLRQRIWHASQQNFFLSHRKGNRFATLNIIERLLPKGYIEPEIMDFHFDCSNKDLKTIDQICDSTSENIAITGEGGIGKTTFMQVILERTFGTEDQQKEYDSAKMIPIFIELNRCPKEIGDWYQDKYKKTNFITRYIADFIQTSAHPYRDYSDLLDRIETEFRTNPYDNPKSYLLLLDGFNEVSTGTSSTGESVRAVLSREISELRKLPNVRIITTSRVTQSAYYANTFTRVHLKGLEEVDIREHLTRSGWSDASTGQVLANTSLMKCLTVPLFLCMFSSKKEYGNQIPETYGEILYHFFHKDSNFYNIRQRAMETSNDPFKHDAYITELILDYVVPYIGWYYVQHDTFSLSRKELNECLKTVCENLCDLFEHISYMPLKDFHYDIEIVKSISFNLRSMLLSNESSKVIAYISDYLSIIYEYETKNPMLEDSLRYGFVHHHFRDYFSAIWNINILRLIPYNRNLKFENKLYHCAFSHYWNQAEVATIAQILQEHHNRPILNSRTRNWILPQPNSEDQRLLTSLLDYCRTYQEKTSRSESMLLQNIINALKTGRGELSGLCFDKLDLRNCNFHNVTCSKKGKSQTLAATFRFSQLSEFSFEPMEHLDFIEECVYSFLKCITIDNGKHLKMWDILSGNQIAHWEIDDESSYDNYNTTGFFKWSYDESLLAVKIQPSNPDSDGAYLLVYPMDYNPSYQAYKITLPKKHRQISDFAITPDSHQIIVIGDSTDIYVFTYNTIATNEHYSLTKQNSLKDMFSNILICTCENSKDFYLYTYDLELIDDYWNDDEDFNELSEYATTDEYDKSEIENDLNIDEEIFDTVCILYKCDTELNTMQNIFTYTSTPGTTPAFAYIPTCNCFLIYDDYDKELKLYDCAMNDTTPVFQMITDENDSEMPATIHYANRTRNICYIMYPHVCYQVEINATGISSIIEKYEAPTLESAQADSESTELTFMLNTAPASHRFLLWNEDRETYEWQTESGQLTYKYNTRLYNTKALIPDNQRNLFILVHAQNGVSIFSQDSCTLINSYCFEETDYKIEQTTYSDKTGCLYLLFERGQHNYVKYINIDTSETETIYSAQRISDGSTKLDISLDGMHLLITTVQSCLEYSYENRTTNCVYFTQPNEWLTTSYYASDTEIHVGVATARNYLQPMFEPRCEIYERDENQTYTFRYGYLIPTLDASLVVDFVHQNHDTGIPCCYKPNGMQSYWITKGFFKDKTEKISAFLNVRKLSRTKDGLQEDGTIPFDSFQMIQVKHEMVIDNKSEVHGTQNTYSYLSSDYKEAMFIYDYEQITYWKDIKNCPANYQTFDYRTMPDATCDGSAYWDFAIPISNNRFICCTENFRLFSVDATTGSFGDEISYYPGLAICGCKFQKAIMSDECKEIVEQNSGVL